MLARNRISLDAEDAIEAMTLQRREAESSKVEARKLKAEG